MAELTEFGTPPWNRREMLDSLPLFAEFYKKRPVSDNTGGMKAPHMFATWFALQKLQPKAIVESGVWYGQGSWLFEQVCPNAKIFCIDPNLDRIRYRPGNAHYFSQDFCSIDWHDLPKAETLVFVDDHQNAYQRVQQAKWFGFYHLMFEDNYPAGIGDCYSLKKAFMESGFIPERTIKTRLKNFVRSPLNFGRSVQQDVPPNSLDAAYLHQNLETYYEFPPVFKPPTTRWGAEWRTDSLPTPPPLLDRVTEPWQQVFENEAQDYTWICYARLKQ